MDIVGVLRLSRNLWRSIHTTYPCANQFAPFNIGPCIFGHRSGSFLCDLRDRLANPGISTAAAEISTQAAANLFRRGMRVRIEKGFTGDHEPRRAETALRRVVIDEGPLYRV